MSKRSEEAALKAYPINSTSKKNRAVQVGRIIAFRNGYEQAKRDLEETMERDALKCYEQGYKQAEKELGWHSVDESLPEIDEEVIVLTDHLNLDCFYKIGFGHIVNEKAKVDIDGKPYKPESHNGWNIPGVKYWMLMPKIPNEE